MTRARIKHLDLWLVALGCLAGAVAVALNAPWPVRLAIGLVCVLALPGYTLSLLAFRPGQLDVVERAALSFSLSICVVLVLAPFIDRLPGGLSPNALVTDLLTTTLVAAGLVWMQRGGVRSSHGPAATVPRRWGRGAIATAIGASVVAGVVAVAVGATLSVPPARVTEFFAVASDGTAAGIPGEVVAGESVELLAGITSHEPGPASFRIDVRTASASTATIGPVTVAPGEAWTGPLSFTILDPADDVEIEILLYRGAETAPYRTLRVTLDVLAEPRPSPTDATSRA